MPQVEQWFSLESTALRQAFDGVYAKMVSFSLLCSIIRSSRIVNEAL